MLLRTYSYMENKPAHSSTGVGFITVKSDVSEEKIKTLIDGKNLKLIKEFEWEQDKTEYYDSIHHKGERFLPDAPILGDIELTTVKYPKEKKKR